jgi:hypothetical protein
MNILYTKPKLTGSQWNMTVNAQKRPKLSRHHSVGNFNNKYCHSLLLQMWATQPHKLM